LVGDAGHHKDPLLGQGIADAFRDAELLAEAVDAGLSGLEPLEAALAGYEQRRNTAAKPAYELTSAVARLDGPRTELARLAREAEESPAGVEHLLGVFAGVLPVALVAGQ
jgi:2-polyprenyl-6-methoxyphenol hydroxylase-like FAD-dependent oxidoreductase